MKGPPNSKRDNGVGGCRDILQSRRPLADFATRWNNTRNANSVGSCMKELQKHNHDGSEGVDARVGEARPAAAPVKTAASKGARDPEAVSFDPGADIPFDTATLRGAKGRARAEEDRERRAQGVFLVRRLFQEGKTGSVV